MERERRKWIQRWAKSWREELKDFPPSPGNYVYLPLQVAVEMIGELLAELPESTDV